MSKPDTTSSKKDYSKYNIKWLHIKVTLPKEDEDLFQRFKDEKKFTTNNEVMRYCFYHTMDCEGEKKATKVDPSLELVIDDFLKSPFYKRKYAIFNKSDFLNRAIIKFIDEIRAEMSLHNMAFRDSLPEMEKKVAYALIELQYESDTYGIPLEKLLDHLKSKDAALNEDVVKRVLFSFIERQLLVQERFEKEIHYAIPV